MRGQCGGCDWFLGSPLIPTIVLIPNRHHIRTRHSYPTLWRTPRASVAAGWWHLREQHNTGLLAHTSPRASLPIRVRDASQQLEHHMSRGMESARTRPLRWLEKACEMLPAAMLVRNTTPAIASDAQACCACSRTARRSDAELGAAPVAALGVVANGVAGSHPDPTGNGAVLARLLAQQQLGLEGFVGRHDRSVRPRGDGGHEESRRPVTAGSGREERDQASSWPVAQPRIRPLELWALQAAEWLYSFASSFLVMCIRFQFLLLGCACRTSRLPSSSCATWVTTDDQ